MNKGVVASKGIAIGCAYIYKPEEITLEDSLIGSYESDEEFNKFENAVSLSYNQIELLKSNLLKEVGEENAHIFDAHLSILADEELLEEIKRTIFREKCCASTAVKRAEEKFIKLFSAIDDAYIKERVIDLKDVCGRIVKNIQGGNFSGISQLEYPAIIIAHDLTPSDTANLDKKNVLGFITEIGNLTSHTAIIAKSLGIPAIVGAQRIMSLVSEKDKVILDALDGEIIVNPDNEIEQKYLKISSTYKYYQLKQKELNYLEAKTLDKINVQLMGNAGSISDIEMAISNGAEGIGLFRTEFLYMGKREMPNEEEQFQEYRRAAEYLKGKQLIIRTLDIGGDKTLPYLPMEHEMNPFMGLRAIRLCFVNKKLFQTQIRAILRASKYGNIAVMYPMISNLQELRQAKDIMREVMERLTIEGIGYDANIKEGIMIEIPSAALIADILAKEVDFFSIGTNDLCQYTLAVDRMNENVSNLYQTFHPAVLKLIKLVIEAGEMEGIPVGMCGEMAGDPRATIVLLGLGLRKLSMSVSSLLDVKRAIRSLTIEKAKNFASAVMSMKTSEEIEAFTDLEIRQLG